MKQKFLYVLLIVVLLFGFVGCAPAATEEAAAVEEAAEVEEEKVAEEPAAEEAAAEEAPASDEGPIKLAVVGPMTGDAAQQGLYAMTGAEIAAEEINGAGGIDGRQVELVQLDDKGDPTEAALVAQRIVDDDSIFAVVGHMWSSPTLAAMPIYNEAGVQVLTPTASNKDVTAMGWDNIVRICLKDIIQAPQMSALLTNNLGAKKIAVFYANDDYGRGVLEQATVGFDQLGAEVVYEAPYKPNIDKDFTVQLTAALDAGADGILLGSQQEEGGLIMSQASQLGVFDQIPFFVGNAGMLYQLFLDRVDADAESHVYIASPYDMFRDKPHVQAFVETFKEREGSMPSETASYTYDALYIIKKAVEDGGATKGNLIDTVKSMEFEDLIVSDFVTFDENGDRNERGMFAVTVKDGEFVSAGMQIDVTGLEFAVPEPEAEAEAPKKELDPNAEPIKLAVVGPMTGDAAQQGLYAMTGAEIAVEELMAADGIDGRPIELVQLDDKGDPTEAALVAQRIVDDDSIFAVVGHMWSSPTLAAMPIYNEAGVQVLTPTASNKDVTAMGWDNIVRICLKDIIQAPQMSALLTNNLGATKIAVFYANDDYGRGVLEQATVGFEQLGAEVVYEAPYKPNIDKDFTVQLTAALDAGADGILLGSQQEEGGLIMSQASQLGVFDQIPFFVGNAGMLYQLFLDRLDADAEGHIYIASPYDMFRDQPHVKAFVETFQEREGSTPSETASYTYDAVYIIKKAVEAGATKDDLIDTVKSMEFENLVVSDFVTFDENGDRNERGMFAVTVEDGAFVSAGMQIDVTGLTFGSE